MKYKSRKHDVDEEFFSSIQTEEQAWVLGYLFADGCVRDKWTFSVSSKDLGLVALVKHLLKSDHPLYRHKKVVDDKEFFTYDLTITSKQMIKDLTSYGCIQRKSYKELSIPKIPPKLICHFIRGYFDGDGGAAVDKQGNIKCYFVGCLTLLTEIQSHLVKQASVNRTKILTHSSIFKLTYSGNGNAQKIRDYLYKDAFCFLTRKKDVMFSKNPKYKIRL